MALRNSLQGAYRITLPAMFIVLSLFFLYLSSVVPTGRLGMYFLSSIFIAPLVIENELGLAAMVFLATSILGFLILPDKLMIVPFVAFVGHYGIGKALIEKLPSRVLAFLLKLAYFNIALVLAYIFASNVLLADFSSELPLWQLALGAQAVFIVYDFAYTLWVTWYFKTLRPRLIKSR